jgi:RNA polymerase sigma factor (sigma-70 family)
MNDPQPAFEQFYRDHYRGLIAGLLAAGGTWPEAEDALHEAMVDALRRWGQIRHPRAYVRTAALHNLVRTKTRTRKEMNETDEDGVESSHATGQELWEQEEWVTTVLNSLSSDRQREVMACVIDDFTPAEIADLLGRSRTAVRQNLCAARRRLRRYLGEEGR